MSSGLVLAALGRFREAADRFAAGARLSPAARRPLWERWQSAAELLAGLGTEEPATPATTNQGHLRGRNRGPSTAAKTAPSRGNRGINQIQVREFCMRRVYPFI